MEGVIHRHPTWGFLMWLACNGAPHLLGDYRAVGWWRWQRRFYRLPLIRRSLLGRQQNQGAHWLCCGFGARLD